MIDLKKIGIVFTDTVPKGSSYIMSDGKFVDLNVSQLYPKYKIKYHEEFDRQLGRLINKIRYQFQEKENAIRINDGSNFKWEMAYISLPKKKITTKQEISLINFMYTLMEYKVPQVYIGNEKYDPVKPTPIKIYDFLTLNNESGYLPEDIIKEIRRSQL